VERSQIEKVACIVKQNHGVYLLAAGEPGDKSRAVLQGGASAVFLMRSISRISRVYSIVVRYDPRFSPDQKYTNAALRDARSPLFHHVYSFVIILLARRHAIILHNNSLENVSSASRKSEN